MPVTVPLGGQRAEGKSKPVSQNPAQTKSATFKQVRTMEPETPSGTDDLLELLLSDSDAEQVNLVQVQDKGSSAKGVTVQIQGVPAVGVIDSGSDLTIIGADLFAKVALAARLHKRDFKKADRILRTYDQRTFSLDGRLDLDIEFAGKSMNTPVYVRKEAQDQLLLSEGVCRQLGIITYHPVVQPFKQLVRYPHGNRGGGTDESVAQVPMVRVLLVQAVRMLPHQSLGVPVRVDGPCSSKDILMVEPSDELRESTGVHIEEALINTSSDGVAYLVLSNPNGVSCQVDVNACIGVVHEVSLVDPGTEPPQELGGPTVGRVETLGDHNKVGWRKQKLPATVKS